MLDLSKCRICPNECGTNRQRNLGYCNSSDKIVIARACLHEYEEPCVSGTNGSGTIFFSGCNMRCLYCQNYEISRKQTGKVFTVKELADLFKKLEDKKAHNINLVSPSHYAPQIMEALDVYRPDIPIIYNTNGYEKASTISALKDYIDVYLTDLKYADKNTARILSDCPNYPDYAFIAIAEMIKNKGKPVFFPNGLMKSGVIIRHLVIPSYIRNSLSVVRAIADNFKEHVLVSIMSQYTPLPNLKLPREINRPLTPLEYKTVISAAQKANITAAYIQELSSCGNAYIPNFKEGFNFI
jgi:putative pyruvate formate lyase activating enzyme